MKGETMKENIKLWVIVVLCLCTGCSHKDLKASGKLSDTNAVLENHIIHEPQVKKEALLDILSKEEFMPFFKALYGYDEVVLERLNAYHTFDASEHIEDLAFYKAQIKEQLGPYLSSQLKNRLEEACAPLDLDLPQKVRLNGYLVEGSGKIEELEIESLQQYGEHLLYGISITSMHRILDEENTNQLMTEGGPVDKEKDCDKWQKDELKEETSTANLDEMKIKSAYWIEVSRPKEKSMPHFQIEGIKQAGPFNIEENVNQTFTNTQYIQRVPYNETITQEEKEIITTVLLGLMSAPEEAHHYYEANYGEDYEKWRAFWKSIMLINYVDTNRQTYLQAYPERINPYIDDIGALHIEEENLRFTPSCYSTKYRPCYMVEIPVQALLVNGGEKRYVYRYLVSLGAKKIQAIRWIELDEMYEEHLAKDKEAVSLEDGFKEDSPT